MRRTQIDKGEFIKNKFKTRLLKLLIQLRGGGESVVFELKQYQFY
jgi:hypothetical protein